MLKWSHSSCSLSHGRLTFQAITLMNLIQQAYDVQRVRVAGVSSVVQ